MEENHILRPLPLFLGNLVSTAVQYSGSIDCRKFFWQQCTGCRQLVGKSHLSDGRLFNGIAIGQGLIARYFGARDIDNMQRAIHTTVASVLFPVWF